MIESDKDEFKQVLVGLGELHDKKISRELASLYWSALSDLTIEQLKQAASLHLNDKSNDGKFWPKPSTLRAYIEGSEADKKDDIENRANVAWLEITAKIRTLGAYGTLDMEDKQALMAVRSMGTWQDLCHTPYEQLDWKRKAFIENYKSLESTDCEHLQALPGIHELQNQRAGASGIGDLLENIKMKRLS